MVKACDYKLIEKFEFAVREYIELRSLISNKDYAPNFDPITIVINENQDELKEDKRGSLAKELEELYEYLETLNGDNPNTWLSDIHNRNETIPLSGNATKAYQALCKEVASYVEPEAQRENTVSFTTALCSYGTWIGSVVSHVAKNPGEVCATAAKTVAGGMVTTGNTVRAAATRVINFVASHPGASGKAATAGLLYTLANQPVAGMMIADNIIREANKSRAVTINRMLNSKPSDWRHYYDSIEIMLQEFKDYASEISEDDKRLFFNFLEEAANKNKFSNLSDQSKEILLNITKDELEKTYNLNEESDNDKLYKLFLVISKLGYRGNKDKIKIIFNLLDRYATELASHRIVLNSENTKSLKISLQVLYWILQLNFDKYTENLDNFSNIDEIKRHFEAIQKMNLAFYQFDNHSVESFRLGLILIQRLRSYSFKDNQEMCSYLDNVAQAYIAEALSLVENTCFAVKKDQIKESAYIFYVIKLPHEARQSFKNLYKIVRKDQVFPHLSPYKFPSETNAKQFIIYSQQPLGDEKKSIVEEAIYNTCNRTEKFKSELSLIDQEDVSKITFRVHLFNDKKSYVSFGPLWKVNTVGGGYAHVRTSSEEELPFHYSQPLQDDKRLYETFIYQKEGDKRNTKEKEGGNFRNLGHEIQHTLFYALIGEQQLNHLPSWLVEGIANYLGNENCFKEEADYIKEAKEQGRLFSIEKIINCDYADGGDLYYLGSTLVHFMREKHPNILQNILIAAQSGKDESEIKQMAKQWATHPEIEDEFEIWTTQLINGCAKTSEDDVSTEAPTEAPTDLLTEYHKDLQNNPSLLQWIESKGPIELTFGDIIFTLEADKFTAINYAGSSRFQKQVTLGDYIWLKQALAIYAVKNKLEENNSIENSDTLLENYFLRYNFPFVKDYTLEKVNLPENDEFKGVIEDFALKTCLPLFIGESLSKQEFYNSLLVPSTVSPEPELTEPLLLPTCQAYLKSKGKDQEALENKSVLKDQPVLENKPVFKKKLILSTVQKSYRKDLKKNPDLLNFIKEQGFIEFTFGDTTFNLTADRISRHYRGYPQSMTPDDYAWLKSALAVYTVKIALQPFKLSAKNYSNVEQLFIRQSKDTIASQRIKATQPKVNKEFNQVIEGFALKTFFRKRRKNFYNRLYKNAAQFKKSPFYVLDELSTGRKPQPAYLLKQPDFSVSRSALIASVHEAKNPSFDESGTWASIALPLAAGLSGIAIAGFFCFNKKRKAKTKAKAKRNASLTTQSCPKSVVSMAPERMSLTHSSVNQTHAYVPSDCVTQPLRENDAEAQRPLLSGHDSRSDHDSRQASNPSNLFQPKVAEKSGTEQGSSLSANRS